MELSQLRIDIENDYRGKLETWKEQIEQIYSEKLSKLRAREENILSKLKDRERLVEQAAYEHRQQVLKDVEMMKSKEREIERIKSTETDRIRLQLEKIQNMEKECASKKSTLEQKMKEQELVINKEIQQFKHDWELEHESLSKGIKQDSLEMKREKENLKMEVERVQDYKDELKMLKEELREYKSRYTKLQNESDSTFKDQFQLKEQLRIVSDGARRD